VVGESWSFSTRNRDGQGRFLGGTIETSGSTHQHASPHITDNYSFRSLRIPIVKGALRVSDTVWEPPLRCRPLRIPVEKTLSDLALVLSSSFFDVFFFLFSYIFITVFCHFRYLLDISKMRCLFVSKNFVFLLISAKKVCDFSKILH